MLLKCWYDPVKQSRGVNQARLWAPVKYLCGQVKQNGRQSNRYLGKVLEGRVTPPAGNLPPALAPIRSPPDCDIAKRRLLRGPSPCADAKPGPVMKNKKHHNLHTFIFHTTYNREMSRGFLSRLIEVEV